eukprot:5468203-Prymnesium_polylepis.2
MFTCVRYASTCPARARSDAPWVTRNLLHRQPRALIRGPVPSNASFDSQRPPFSLTVQDV